MKDKRFVIVPLALAAVAVAAGVWVWRGSERVEEPGPAVTAPAPDGATGASAGAAEAAGAPAHATEARPAAEDFPPELRGVLVLGDQRRFVLSTPGGTRTEWLALGELFQDWELVSYRDETQQLRVRKEGLDVEVPLVTSRIVTEKLGSKGTVPQAEALMRQMNFKAMFDRMIEQQKKASVSMMRQMMAADKGAGGVDPEAMAAFQQKVMEVMWAELNPEQMQADMAQAYAEVFSAEEMQGMAEFYATPAGQATLEKAPELQQRLMQSMMPRLMAAMPKIREMGRQFAEEQRALHAAGPAAEGGAAPTPPPPSTAPPVSP